MEPRKLDLFYVTLKEKLDQDNTNWKDEYEDPIQEFNVITVMTEYGIINRIREKINTINWKRKVKNLNAYALTETRTKYEAKMVKSKSDFDGFYKNNDFISECIEANEKNFNTLSNILAVKYKAKEPIKIYYTTGKYLNDVYDLHGDNRYQNDSEHIIFPLNSVPSKYHTQVKQTLHARFFNDVVDNNEYREYIAGYHKASPQIQWLIGHHGPKDESTILKEKCRDSVDAFLYALEIYNEHNSNDKNITHVKESDLELPGGYDDTVKYEDAQTLLDNTDPSRIFLTSDWHLFKNRFKKERNLVNTKNIITWCRQNIKEDDVFMYLGDISYRYASDEDSEEAHKIMASIPGHKIIVLGNHDIDKGDYNEKCKFEFVFNGELIWNNIVFTHRPINMEHYNNEWLNIHGHMHNMREYNTTDGKRNINVYPMFFDNKPVTLEYILNHVEELTKDNKRSNWINMGEAGFIEAKRSDLPDSVFGIPEDRKYPLDSKKHVYSAIKLFGHAEESKKRELAKRIKSAANKYSIDIPESTQVAKYLVESAVKVGKIDIPELVDTIVFDMGSVLVESNFIDALKTKGIPEEYIEEIYDILYNHVWLHKDRPSIEWEPLYVVKEYFKSKAPDHIKPYTDDVFDSHLPAMYKFDYVDDLLDALKSKGYKLYYLSNWQKYSMELEWNFFKPLLEKFDGGLFSFECHNTKPSISIYKTFLDKFNLDASRCMFFDDKQENIDAARLVGMNAELFDQSTPIKIFNTITSNNLSILLEKSNNMLPVVKDGVLDYIDTAQITWYHTSEKSDPGTPDEELYYKTLNDSIRHSIHDRDFEESNTHVERYVFTANNDLVPIALGKVYVYRDESWQWIIQYPLVIDKDKLKNKIKTSVKEWSMASCNPIRSISKPFILKVRNNTSLLSPVSYAFSPDVICDKYLVINENAQLEVIDYSKLRDMLVEEYEFIGDKRNIKKIEEAYKNGKIVDNTFFYTALSGKPMLSEDQIDFDPLFRRKDFIGERNTFLEKMLISSTYAPYTSLIERVRYIIDKKYNGEYPESINEQLSIIDEATKLN